MDELALSRLLAQGLSVTTIGELLGKHPTTVRHWMRSNCHAEVEDGVVASPDTVREVSPGAQ